MKLTKEQIESIKRMYQEGKSLKQISDELKINYNIVQYHAKENYRKEHIQRVSLYQKIHPRKNTEKRREYMKKYMREYNKNTNQGSVAKEGLYERK